MKRRDSPRVIGLAILSTVPLLAGRLRPGNGQGAGARGPRPGGSARQRSRPASEIVWDKELYVATFFTLPEIATITVPVDIINSQR